MATSTSASAVLYFRHECTEPDHVYKSTFVSLRADKRQVLFDSFLFHNNSYAHVSWYKRRKLEDDERRMLNNVEKTSLPWRNRLQNVLGEKETYLREDV